MTSSVRTAGEAGGGRQHRAEDEDEDKDGGEEQPLFLLLLHFLSFALTVFFSRIQIPVFSLLSRARNLSPPTFSKPTFLKTPPPSSLYCTTRSQGRYGHMDLEWSSNLVYFFML